MGKNVNAFARERFRAMPEGEKHAVEEVYRHPDFKETLPFDPKELACFLDRNNGSINLRVLPYHHRSADLGVTTSIKQNACSPEGDHVYCQIDIKGAGFLYPEKHTSKLHAVKEGDLAGYPEAFFVSDSKETAWGYDVLGLMDYRLAAVSARASALLIRAGMRTEALISVMKLKTLFIEGNEVSVKKFVEDSYRELQELAATSEDVEERKAYRAKAADLRKEFYPVLAVRLMRSVLRMRDLHDSAPELREAQLLEASRVLNHEAETLGKPERYDVTTPEGRERYFVALSGMLGKNLGILHRENFIHAYLHMGNLTLAGEIVDLDSCIQAVVDVPYNGDPKNKASSMNRSRKGVDRLGYPVELPPLSESQYVHETETGWTILNSDLETQRLVPEFGIPACLVKDFRDLCFSVHKTLEVFRGSRGRVDASNMLVAEYAAALRKSGNPFAKIGFSDEVVIEGLRKIATRVIARGESMKPVLTDAEVSERET